MAEQLYVIARDCTTVGYSMRLSGRRPIHDIQLFPRSPITSASALQEVQVVVYAVGDRVKQPQYGDGTITIANDRHTVIEFDDHGSRTFVTMLVQLERAFTTAPVKPAKTRRSVRKQQSPAA